MLLEYKHHLAFALSYQFCLRLVMNDTFITIFDILYISRWN